MNRLLLLPTLAINMVVILVPALLTVALAFFRWDGITDPVFVGLANFRALGDDRVFWIALRNNIVWTVIFLTIPIAVGLVIASMMLTVRSGRTAFQLIFFLPMIIATVITARIWEGMIFHPNNGLFGWLGQFGIDLPNPLARPSTALYGVAAVDLWHWWGFLAVVFFAALRQVPSDLIEAAQIEGANFFQMLRFVLLPAIMPTIALMAIMTVIWSFLVFDFIFILTEGGPAFSSEVLATYAYRKAFFDLQVGQAAAAALIISIFGIIATIFYIRIQAREGDL